MGGGTVKNFHLVSERYIATYIHTHKKKIIITRPHDYTASTLQKLRAACWNHCCTVMSYFRSSSHFRFFIITVLLYHLYRDLHLQWPPFLSLACLPLLKPTSLATIPLASSTCISTAVWTCSVPFSGDRTPKRSQVFSFSPWPCLWSSSSSVLAGTHAQTTGVSRILLTRLQTQALLTLCPSDQVFVVLTH